MTLRRRSVSARWSLAAIVVVALLAATACSGDAADEAQISAALEASRPITFTNDVGDELDGRLFGPGDATAGVVLAHGLSASQEAWYPFADRLGDEGYRVLTFNFRGYCPGGDAGCSEGEQSIEEAPADLRSAIETLRGEGVSRIAVIGSSMGATATLLVAAEEDLDLAAVVSLSAPSLIDGLAVDADTLARIQEAKLFIAGTEDATAAVTAEDLFEASQQPKRLEILTTDDHGAEILRGNQGERARTEIMTWFAVYLPVDEADG